MADTEAITREAERLAVDCLYSEKSHFIAATPWRTAHLWLGVPAALLAFAAGAGFTGEYLGKGTASALAFLSGSFAAIATFLTPEDKAKAHHASGVQYANLRRQIRQFSQICCSREEATSEELATQLNDLTKKLAEAQKNSRPIPQRAYKQAKAQISQVDSTASYTAVDIKQALDEG